ncbi:SusC/RagA family TonB-linked outer membrane protein [Joostella sp. CR20]|uniref:SusC/RagA family TonB-linked outer membrane protein n=1 Tax=Joostella sp. CR20 TaxID=2804312 RepID=UPI00313BC0C5
MMLKFKFAIIALVLVCTQSLYAQTKTISGVVTDATGVPMPGVTVLVEGTSNGSRTDFDGNYSIDGVNASDSLVFTYIGMVSQTIQVGTQTTINVTLEESMEALEEVVVVGYGVQKKALTTGANVNVKGEDIAKLNTGTAMEALQGVTPGVTVSRNNGAPGAGTKVTIRGLGTIGNSNPLYIVDGVAVGNIDYLSSGDIESIDVLKDAASAAIYGSRAANGVVLVTTRQGKKGRQAQIHYETYYGFQNIYKNLSPLNAQEYMYIMDEGRVNDGLAPNNWEAMIKNNSWLNNTYPGQLGTQLGEEVWAMLQNGWEGTNWIDEMTSKNAPISNHAISITGGNEDITYSLGASYFDQKGIIGGDITDAGFKRLTTRLNTEFVLFKNDSHSIITVGENFTYSQSENRSVATGNIYWNDLHNALVQHPLMPAYWADSPDQYGFTPTMDGISNFQHNPIAVLYYRHNYANLGNTGNTIVGNVYAEIEPLKNLKFRSSYGINAWFGHSRSWAPTYALGTLYGNATDGVTQSQYLGNNSTWTNTISYDATFGDHKLTALIGTEVYKNEINTEVGGTKSDSRFGLPDYAFLNNVDKTVIGAIDTWGADWAAGGGGLLSYMARAQYNYKEKYLFSATMRADGSSNFAEGNRWGYFPSVSAGWVISQENFMNNSNSFVKLRASWGQNGNQSIDNFIYSSSIAYLNPGYYFGDTKPISGPTGVPARVTNPDVTWETSEQLNFGLDTRFFDSRLAFTVDWYKKTTKDWLVLAPILGTSGAGAPYINGGDIENKGFEVMLSWNDKAGDFSYGATVTGAYNKNEITRIANADGVIQGQPHILSQGTAYISRAEVGYPIGYFYGYETDGILQNQDEVDAYVKPTDGTPYFSDQRPGDVRFVDQNQDGVIDEADKTMLGNPNPDFELGIQLNAEYKGFYTNVTMTGKFGMQVMQSYRSFADNPNQNYTTDIFDRWHGEGTSNTIPRLSSVSNRNTNWISDIYMHDADYLRISNLTVGFKLGEYLNNVNYIKDINIYVAVNNLYTFTGYDGMDPDVSYGGNDDTAWASGVDLGLYPLPRTVMLGLSVDF